MEVINQITLTLVKKVQEDFSQYSYQYERKVFCAFNLTAQQIENKPFIDQLIDQLIDMLKSETYFIASFEITERQHFKNLAMAKMNIRSLQGQGIKLNWMMLERVTVALVTLWTLMKIDKMFIDVIGVDDAKVEVLNAIIMMAKRLGIDIVAEGVKIKQQVDFLRAHKIDYIQGYY